MVLRGLAKTPKLAILGVFHKWKKGVRPVQGDFGGMQNYPKMSYFWVTSGQGPCAKSGKRVDFGEKWPKSVSKISPFWGHLRCFTPKLSPFWRVTNNAL